MTDYHEPPENMSEQDRDFVRALRSLIEEIEAVDWYQQRIASSGDEELLTILSHNRNEEMEHACMTLEWLRRNMPGWDEKLRLYLFTEGDIASIGEEPQSSAAASPGQGLGIGDPRRP
ncbi:MAG: ferritin-like domain-containing protein [Acidobacteriota bacterium]